MKQALWLNSIDNEKILHYEKLTGGVSSEVYKVKTKKNNYCIKRSLAKLLTKKEWLVDINRIKYEYLWLTECKKILNRNIPKIYEFNRDKNYIVMEYFDNHKYKTLKEIFFNRIVNLNTIKSIAKHLYKIHSLNKNLKIKKAFKNNSKNFYDLRLDAYFNEVAVVHPEYRKKIIKLNKDYLKFSTTLVHGDFSPKNILIKKGKIIYIDAECANYGDPVFDLVFFTNHLLIKSVYFSKDKTKFLKAYKSFYKEYFKNLSKNNKVLLLQRIIKMTPFMMLARVDGKSPAEYLTSKKIKDKLRNISFKLINNKINDINKIIEIVNE